MELIDTLFEGSPRFWGGGVAHSVMILAIVISLGLILGRVKVKGVTAHGSRPQLGVNAVVNAAKIIYKLNEKGFFLVFLIRN